VWPRWLVDALSGKVSLARAFWVYGLGISVAYSLIELFIDPENPLVTTFYVLVGVALGILQTIILWRCAYNSRSRFLGRFVRIGIVLGFIAMGVVLYVLYQFGRAAAS